MALLRRFSIRRVVVSVVVGVVAAAGVDVGSRLWIGRTGPRYKEIADGGRAYATYSTDAVHGTTRVHGVRSALMDMGIAAWFPAAIRTRSFAETATPPPTWTRTIAFPYRDQLGHQFVTCLAFGVPLRSSVTEYPSASALTIDPVIVAHGEAWIVQATPGDQRVHRVRIVPALFNVTSYAFVTWIALTGFAFGRRRLRRSRGVCEVCSYPTRGAAVCSECGTAVRPGAAAATQVAATSHSPS
ncbi:MAG TPA: hypothetical protein VK157_16275 [Phycisphaerales bacterium]|nr:hypothetical protein [Phycisphaerales bacterium]